MWICVNSISTDDDPNWKLQYLAMLHFATNAPVAPAANLQLVGNFATNLDISFKIGFNISWKKNNLFVKVNRCLWTEVVSGEAEDRGRRERLPFHPTNGQLLSLYYFFFLVFVFMEISALMFITCSHLQWKLFTQEYKVEAGAIWLLLLVWNLEEGHRLLTMLKVFWEWEEMKNRTS